MHTLTLDQKARLFALYLEHPVRLCLNIEGNPVDKKLTTEYLEDVLSGDFDYKLLLRPLSAITDEHAIEIAKVYGSNTDDDQLASDVKERDLLIGWGKRCAILENNINQWQLLLSFGYAVPHFIAPNHPDNNKTMIEMGLAIDSTL